MTSPLFTYVSRLALVFAAALLMGASSTAALAQPQPSQAAAQPSPSAQASQAPVSVSSISASFYPNPTDSGAFIANPSTAVTFTQDFPALNFNTPPDTVKCNPSVNVTPDTTPFTDVVPQPDGSCKTIVAQGNKQQAAAGDMRNFQAVFTGSLQVAAPGRVTFNVYSDDGWILSMGPSGSGAQPGYVSGPMLNFPRVGPFTGYAIVGSYNVESAPNQNNLVVSFPSAGTYPFELDYSDCCAGTQALTVLANGVPIPPTTLDTAPAATVAPTVVATAVPVPTTIPVTTTVIPAQNGNAINPILIAAAAAIVLLLIGAVLLFLLVLRKPRQKPAPVQAEVRVAEPEPVPADDRTEFIGRVPPADLTVVSNRHPRALPTARLLVKPDREIQLNRATDTVIGRDPSNAAYVDDRQVSRHHAKISSLDGDFWIEDLNSTNGTRVNGATITRQKLANNDQINVGDTIITFAVES